MDVLKECRMDEDTIIVFSSDHGQWSHPALSFACLIVLCAHHICVLDDQPRLVTWMMVLLVQQYYGMRKANSRYLQEICWESEVYGKSPHGSRSITVPDLIA